MKIIGPAHFSFTVADIERSKHFYGDVLGLPLVYEMVHAHPYTGKQVGFPNAHLLAAGFHLGSNERDGLANHCACPAGR